MGDEEQRREGVARWPGCREPEDLPTLPPNVTGCDGARVRVEARREVSMRSLCLHPTVEGECLRMAGHGGSHSPRPSLWGAISDDPGARTRKKVVKAGFATPRGGAKGGYQNHVARSSRVIIPYEHAPKVDFDNYEQGAVVRVTVPQAIHLLAHDELVERDERLYVIIGGRELQAFVLYRSAQDVVALPAHKTWRACEHLVSGVPVTRRTATGVDVGHYLHRMPKQPPRGLPQGIFAPEYAKKEVNYECQLLLTHLAYRTEGHQQDENAEHVRLVLRHRGMYQEERWHDSGLINSEGVTTCPLCNRAIASDELHETIDPSRVPGLANSGVQLAETRSTLVNLFHLRPLLYSPVLGHAPDNVAWGHAHCNTFLGQRPTYSLSALQRRGASPRFTIYCDDTETFLRSDDGRAWVSVTPLPPGSETLTTYLASSGLADILEPETDDAEDGDPDQSGLS